MDYSLHVAGTLRALSGFMCQGLGQKQPRPREHSRGTGKVVGFKEGMPEEKLEESNSWHRTQCKGLKMRLSLKPAVPGPKAEHYALWKAAATTKRSQM